VLSNFEQKILKIIGFLLFCGLATVATVLYNVGDNRGYAPEQPIPFSHKIHAGDNQIPCMYCHVNADKSRHSTVPSMNICMNCHKVVKTDSPWIQKLTQAYKENKPLNWVKVHDMPDHVYFNHKRHIAKGIDCSTCHGDVAKQDRVTQNKTLNMGFCVKCHRENKAPTECSTCHN